MDRKYAERVELHCHSVYSQEDGVSTVKDIIEFAADNGMTAVALTDHDSVSGFVEAAHYSSQHENFKMIYGMEAFAVNDLEPSVTGDEKYIKESPSFHVTFLIMNETGKENLYQLMSDSEEKYKAFKPRMPWSEIQKNREGLLVGSACEVGELYLAVMDGESDGVLEEIASRYDYIEVQPAENKLYCVDDDEASYVEGLEYVQKFDKKVIEIADRLGKMIVATSDAHFVTQEEAVVRAVLQRHLGYADDNQLEIYFRTTEEMLGCFSYLGEERAWEIVVENSNKIAEMIDDVTVVYKTGEHYPILNDASGRLRRICFQKAHEIYGDDISQKVLDQLNWELHSLEQSGSDSIMLHAKELVDDSGLSPYEFGYRGNLGGMLVAYLCGITCFNPLEAKMLLYPEFMIGLDGDKYLDVDFNFPSEIKEAVWDDCNDLEDIGASFHAGIITSMNSADADKAIEEYEEYNEVYFEPERRQWIFDRLRNVTRKQLMNPGAMVLIPEDYSVYEFTPLVQLSGKGHWATAISYHDLENLSRFDILTNKHINMLYALIRKTGVNVENISLDDDEVEKLFAGLNKEVSLVGIPEFDTEYVREAAKEFGVSDFTDVIQLSCLMHGTNVWEDNGEDLLHMEGMSKDNIVASREDIFDCLLALGFTREDAFMIAEFVRKGKARPESEKWQGYRKMMTEASVPDWFILSCEKIRYMFPRAHAYIYALHAWWIAWFKLNYPKEFYDTYLDLLASENLKEMLSKGREAFEIYKAGYSAAISDSYWGKDIDAVKIEEFLVAEEMLNRLCAK